MRRLWLVAAVFGSVSAAHAADMPDLPVLRGGFTDGLTHPFSGLDHVLAMVAVGLWASQLGKRAMILLPLTFPAVMAVGLPSDNVHVTGPFLIAGWAIDADAPSGSGVDAIHAWAWPAAGGPPPGRSSRPSISSRRHPGHRSRTARAARRRAWASSRRPTASSDRASTTPTRARW